jgi:hypothetical protein
MRHLTFFFDVVSPYAYLAFKRLPQALETAAVQCSVVYSPIFFGALLQNQHVRSVHVSGRVLSNTMLCYGVIPWRQPHIWLFSHVRARCVVLVSCVARR